MQSLRRHNGIEWDDKGAFCYVDDAQAAIKAVKRERDDLSLLLMDHRLNENRQISFRKDEIIHLREDNQKICKTVERLRGEIKGMKEVIKETMECLEAGGLGQDKPLVAKMKQALGKVTP